VAAELAAGITERFADSLLAPVVRVASPDVPVPFGPDSARICEAARTLASG
jgi:pyruvate/2-oxoglutarate/acetoin dehydrogenase E1 component